MAAQTTAALLDWLVDKAFLSAQQEQQLLSRGDGPAAALLRELVQRQWLTPFQANRIGQDQGDTLVLGPYRLVERLGEGGMGNVYKAVQVNLERVVALKVIHADKLTNPKVLERFRREAKAVAQLTH